MWHGGRIDWNKKRIRSQAILGGGLENCKRISNQR